MKVLVAFITFLTLATVLTGCQDVETTTKSGHFKQIYQSGDGGASTDVHVYEDLVTGDLLYFEDTHGTFHIRTPKKEQLPNLYKVGYINVTGE